MGKTIKYTYEEVKSIINNLGYELISKEYVNSKSNLIVKDKYGYMYFTSLNRLKTYGKNKFDISNPYTIHNIKLWCKINQKPFELISEIYENSDKDLHWKCLKEECSEVFESNWKAISQNRGCGFCHGLQVGLSNCLATKNPELASEWNLTLNGDLTPYDVTENSKQEVYWQCPNNPKHTWKAKISDRNSKNSGCPYCNNKLPCEDHNLLIVNPKLCEEWNYIKNDKKPEEYLPHSKKSVWWKCKECGHEWKAQIDSRNGMNSGCPSCNEPKGEKEINNVLTNNEWIKICQEEFNELNDIDKNTVKYFIPQKTFNGLLGIGNGLLSYDFFLPKYNLLIEYQGNYHDGTARNQTKVYLEIQQEHDKRKREYAKNNNIRLLEIWYYDFDRIEEILEKELLNNVN